VSSNLCHHCNKNLGNEKIIFVRAKVNQKWESVPVCQNCFWKFYGD